MHSIECPAYSYYYYYYYYYPHCMFSCPIFVIQYITDDVLSVGVELTAGNETPSGHQRVVSTVWITCSHRRLQGWKIQTRMVNHLCTARLVLDRHLAAQLHG